MSFLREMRFLCKEILHLALDDLYKLFVCFYPEENIRVLISIRNIFFLVLLLICESSHSQISNNVSLVAQLKPDTATIGRYTGCWGYVSPMGNEYAIVGG